MSRLPHPHPGIAQPFRTRDSGLTAKRLRSHDLDRSVWGVRRQLSAEERESDRTSELVDSCRMFVARMPHGTFFSHSTAALVLGVPLPYALESDERLHIGIAAPARAPHATGIIGHRLDLAAKDLVTASGLPTTSAARTWCDLASMLSLHDLVAAGDFLLRWRHPLTTLSELQRLSRSYIGKRGMAIIREALPLLNNRSESRPESRLRVILAQAGLPHSRVNHEIVLTEDGSFVRTDLAFDTLKVLIEYQGDYHRKVQGQWRNDMTRRSRLEAQNWIVIELNADDLRDPDELAARIRMILERRGWRP
jgi:very-short-patch-repair endonuclease